jgi:hypothetical protein
LSQFNWKWVEGIRQHTRSAYFEPAETLPSYHGSGADRDHLILVHDPSFISALLAGRKKMI